MGKTAEQTEFWPPARVAWRALAVFWVALLVLVTGGIVLLLWLGPPHAAAEAETPTTHRESSAETAPESGPLLPAPPPVAARPAAVAAGISAGRVIAAPDPALLEPAPHIPGGFLPRVAADGRTPMAVYAAAADPAERRPRVAVLVAGVGMNVAESEEAAARLPAPVSFAISPYAARIDLLLDHARRAGHEMLASLPLEPAGFPLNDPGHHALLTGAPVAQNAQRLEWVLTRFNGFVGATGALGEMRGERFAASSAQMDPLLDSLAERGLLYVDPRPNARLLNGARPRPHPVAYRGVDILLDAEPGAEAMDAALARLERLAVSRGGAIGLLAAPSPLAVDRLGVWAVALPGHGVALAPVSAVVQMPQAP